MEMKWHIYTGVNVFDRYYLGRATLEVPVRNRPTCSLHVQSHTEVMLQLHLEGGFYSFSLSLSSLSC
jgi:hypothetical protein